MHDGDAVIGRESTVWNNGHVELRSSDSARSLSAAFHDYHVSIIVRSFENCIWQDNYCDDCLILAPSAGMSLVLTNISMYISVSRLVFGKEPLHVLRIDCTALQDTDAAILSCCCTKNANASVLDSFPSQAIPARSIWIRQRRHLKVHTNPHAPLPIPSPGTASQCFIVPCTILIITSYTHHKLSSLLPLPFLLALFVLLVT